MRLIDKDLFNLCSKSCVYFMTLRRMTHWRLKPIIMVSTVEFIDALNLGTVFKAHTGYIGMIHF